MPVRDCKGEVALVERQSCLKEPSCRKLMDDNILCSCIHLISCGSVLEKYDSKYT